VRLLGPVPAGPEPRAGAPVDAPTVRFDVTTSDFDAVLVRLMEHGGRQMDDIETYNGLRIVTMADPDGNLFELLEITEEDA
jgi:predicted lactoylglutathione lyase